MTGVVVCVGVCVGVVWGVWVVAAGSVCIDGSSRGSGSRGRQQQAGRKRRKRLKEWAPRRQPM